MGLVLCENQGHGGLGFVEEEPRGTRVWWDFGCGLCHGWWMWWCLGALCEVKTNEVLGLWICVCVMGFM